MSAENESSGIYRVLYRKWRPKTFDEVVGQGHVTKILKKQVEFGRIPHALMFCGSRGTGKTSCAKIFAKAINCLNNSEGNPCLVCEMCKKIESGNTLDVSEIDAASNNGVENIRSIKEESNFVSSEAKFRVYIIDEFHMLSSGAFNAFLRTLEEPSKNVVFILATTEFNKIPKTIVSRCQKFDFHRVDVKSMVDKLRFISNEEKIDITDHALELICRNAEGSMRDSLSILDQCFSYGRKIDRDLVENTLGISGVGYVEGFLDLILGSKLKESVGMVENLYSQGKNLIKECESIMNYFYDIFYYHVSKSFLDSSVNNHEAIARSSEKISLRNAIKCFRILEEYYYQMFKSTNVKADFEIAVIAIFYKLNGKIPNFDNIKIESKINENKIKDETKTEKISCTVEKKTGNAMEILESWGQILDLIDKNVSNSLASMLRTSKAYIREEEIIVDTNSFIFGMIKKSYAEICSLVEKNLGKSYKILRMDSEKDGSEVDKKSEKMSLSSFAEEAKNSGIDVKFI